MNKSPFKDYFSQLARQYSAFRPTYPTGLSDFTASVCEQRGMAWDCACGSGQATVGLAERFERVIATDASAEQIAQAPVLANVEYRVAKAEDSGIAGNSLDLVVVAQAVHWFDLDAFYAQVARVLRTGGVLALWTYGEPTIEEPGISRIVREFYSQTVGPYWPPERTLVESGYRTLPFPYPDIVAPPFAIRTRWTLPQLLGYLRSWSATGRYVEAHGVDPVAALDLGGVWGDPERELPIFWPVGVRIGRKP